MFRSGSAEELIVISSRYIRLSGPGSPWRRGARRFALAALLVVCAAATARPVVFESFESLDANSKALAVTEGKGVTHGDQAALLREGADVEVDLSRLDPNDTKWLKIDTLTTQPLSQPLGLTFKSTRTTVVRMTGHVRPGSDALWIPISSFWKHFGGEWPGPLKSLEITNPSAESITIDHVRAEPAAAAPKGCSLLDFGSSKQTCWPGFARADTDHPSLIWPSWTARSADREFPDPLTGDYVGPRDPGLTMKVTILAPKGSRAVAWAWLTHDFRDHFPPTEYAMQVGGRNLLRKRMTARQYLGEDGLMRGSDGQWTARWYGEEFCERLCSRVSFPLRGGANQAAMLNCQFAALAMGPAERERELEAYVKTVHEDLLRYRRQFMVATRKQALCTVQPTPEQLKAGLMVFDPNSDRPFDAAWVPEDANEARLLRCRAATGQMALIDLAVVPTQPLAYITPGVDRIRGQTGILRTSPPNTEAWVLQRVPDTRNGTVEFVPWLLRNRATGLAKDEIVHVAVAVWISPSAAPGVYTGNVLLSTNAGTVRVPLEISVTQVNPLSVTPTAIPSGRLTATRLLGTLGASLSKPQQAALQRSLYAHLQRRGMNGFWIDGPEYSSSSGAVSDADMLRAAQMVPPRSMTGYWMIHLGTVRDGVRRDEIRPSSPKYALLMRTALAKCRALEARMGSGKALHYAAYVWSSDTIKEAAAEAALLSSFGARLALHMKPSVVSKMSPEDFRTFLKPYTGLILSDREGVAEVIRRFKALDGERVVLLDRGVGERCAVGFRPAVLGVDGTMAGSIMPDGPVFDGKSRLAKSFVVAESERSLLGTLSGLIHRQGVDDLVLWKQCQRALAQVDQAGRDDEKVAGLRAFMAEIQQQILSARTSLTPDLLADKTHKPSTLERWRWGLLERLEAVEAK